jgi:hypothetical protein
MIREKLFWRGAILALILPVLAFMIYATAQMDGDPVALYMQLEVMGVHTHVMSLCALLNIIPFFIFIRAKREQPAQGVLMVTILFALFIVFSKIWG